MEVKKSQHQYVIGPQGNAINEIFAETGVFVMMPSNADESEMITLRGPQEKLHLALAKVYEKANSVVNLVLPCPTWLHKYIIGKKGAGIQHISQDLPKVHIVFQDDGTIKVNGPPDEVEKARLDLEDQVTKLLESTAFADVMVDAKYHKHIIGSGSSTINKIKSEANVTIDIPDKDSGATVIKIEGNKANVEKARAELASMVEKMENEAKNEEEVKNSFVVRVCVAPEYHPKIIGRKGAVITKLRDDFKVKILLSKKEGDSQEEITITGLEENAEAAKNEILKIVGQYESMVKMEVNIDAKVHSMIIGRGGKSIRNIMEKYKVDIRLPRAGDEDPSLVVVSGDQDACEDCIDHLKIMEEDFIQEAAEQDWERDYMKPTRQVENKESNKKKDGFMVSKAPWDVSSSEAFPSLGGGGGGKQTKHE